MQTPATEDVGTAFSRVRDYYCTVTINTSTECLPVTPPDARLRRCTPGTCQDHLGYA